MSIKITTSTTDNTVLTMRLSVFLIIGSAGLCAAILMSPVMLNQVFNGRDYIDHTNFAQNMLQSGTLQTPHFLWHLLVTLFNKIFPSSFSVSALIVALLSYALLGSIIAYNLHNRIVGHVSKTRNAWLTLFLMGSILIAAPITLLWPLDRHLYFGYIGINVYHNPTVTLLKPIALMSFMLIVQSAQVKHISFTYILTSILITVAAALSKPNYSILLIPVLPVFSLYVYLARKNIRSVYYSLIIIASTIMIIAWQYTFTYSSGGQSSIAFAPFDVASHYSSFLGIKFFLSVAFPLLVTICYWRRVFCSFEMLLSWLLFLCGAVLTYFFTETGSRQYDGNFFWSGQIGLFILFFSSTMFMIEQYLQSSKRLCLRFILLGLVFSLHLLSGLFFYYAELLYPSWYW